MHDLAEDEYGLKQDLTEARKRYDMAAAAGYDS